MGSGAPVRHGNEKRPSGSKETPSSSRKDAETGRGSSLCGEREILEGGDFRAFPATRARNSKVESLRPTVSPVIGGIGDLRISGRKGLRERRIPMALREAGGLKDRIGPK